MTGTRSPLRRPNSSSPRLCRGSTDLNDTYKNVFNSYLHVEFFYYIFKEEAIQGEIPVLDRLKFKPEKVQRQTKEKMYDSERMEELSNACELFSDPKYQHYFNNIGEMFNKDKVIDYVLMIWMHEENSMRPVRQMVAMIDKEGNQVKNIKSVVCDMLQEEGGADRVRKLIRDNSPALGKNILKTVTSAFTQYFSEAVLQQVPQAKKDVDRFFVFQKNFEQKFQEIIYGNGRPVLPEQLEKSASDRIFQKYDEIVAMARGSRDDLARIFKQRKDLQEEDIDRITDNILKKAKDILDQYVDVLASGDEKQIDALVERLEQYKNDTLLKLSIFKGLGGVSPEEMEGVEFTDGISAGEFIGDSREKIKSAGQAFVANLGKPVIRAAELKGMAPEAMREKEIAQMLEMYDRNWGKYPLELKKCLIDGFINKLVDGGDKTRIYKYVNNGELMVFLRIDDLPNGKKYFGSFNASDSVKGGKIGDQLLARVLEKEGRDADIIAVVAPQESVLSWYINKHGFVGYGIDMDYDHTGQPMVKIERKKDGVKRYYDEKYSNDAIKREHDNNFAGNNHYNEDYIILKFSLAKDELRGGEADKMNKKINELTGKKYIITRSIREATEKGGRDVYLCFENTEAKTDRA